ncbi:MAG: hypothetical protein R3B90_22925 [Planctomycetaceae bacterium]
MWDIARAHADEHRWLLSQERGYDVGGDAYRDWCVKYWRRFCRWRYVEHLLGLCRYQEFNAELHGRLKTRETLESDIVLGFVLDQFLYAERENLELFVFAPETYPRNRLLEATILLNVNDARVDLPEWGRLSMTTHCA